MSDELMPNDQMMLATMVYELRREGLSIREVADRLKISADEAVSHYNSYRLAVAGSRMSREEKRELADARYEHLISVWYPAAVSQDEEATKIVMSLMKDSNRINQLDLPDPTDSNVTQNILIVGEDKQAFIQALREGRGQVAVDEKMDEEEDADE